MATTISNTLQIVQNYSKLLPSSFKTLQIAPNSSKLLQVAANCYKLLKIAPNGLKLLDLAWNVSKWLSMALNNNKWLQMNPNESKWLRMICWFWSGSKTGSDMLAVSVTVFTLTIKVLISGIGLKFEFNCRFFNKIWGGKIKIVFFILQLLNNLSLFPTQA